MPPLQCPEECWGPSKTHEGCLRKGEQSSLLSVRNLFAFSCCGTPREGQDAASIRVPHLSTVPVSATPKQLRVYLEDKAEMGTPRPAVNNTLDRFSVTRVAQPSLKSHRILCRLIPTARLVGPVASTCKGQPGPTPPWTWWDMSRGTVIPTGQTKKMSPSP